MKPVYRCKLHCLVEASDGHYVMRMTVNDAHKASGAPAGSYGHSSAIKSIDFERGICVTRNSVYLFEAT